VPRLRFDFPPSVHRGPLQLTDPVAVVRADTTGAVIPALESVQRAVDDGLHAAGYLAYEAAPAFEPAMVVRPGHGMPLLWFGLFEEPGEVTPAGDTEPGGMDEIDWEIEMSRPDHATAVAAIREAIAEGRTYQVNLTTRLRGAFTGDAEPFYHALRRTQGGGWHAFLDLGRHVILSASPELFFMTRGREITTRPMKGTRPRGRWPGEDGALAGELRASAKERAENLMIVDLLRNDLGRVCVPGGVRVPALLDVERYPTVWQMTSTVAGRLRDDVRLVDLLRALFPCGSVTGAPKISTMDVIARVEQSPREVYCGAIGWIGPGGDCAFNVPIRTAWVDRDQGRISFGTGGGVVWDSTAEAEYDELLAKTAVVRDPWPPFRLLETMAVEDGRALRLDRHLRRMAESAERFGYPFPEADIRNAVARAGDAASAGPVRLRITLGPDGEYGTETAPADRVGIEDSGDGAPTPENLPVVTLADTAVDARNPFLYHKTTHRTHYDRHLAAAPGHVFDVLLWNREGNVTEFCRGNVVLEIDGELVTPALEAGLLPGCYRAQLLEEGRIVERAVSLDDLADASRIWLINSVRRWVPVRLESPAASTPQGR
jgi:para-aminobenzoate synthetase/4-amino-4-deoxychorismate lyase